MVVIQCDRCENVFERCEYEEIRLRDDVKVNTIKVGYQEIIGKGMAGPECFDLCPECVKDLEKWFYNHKKVRKRNNNSSRNKKELYVKYAEEFSEKFIEYTGDERDFVKSKELAEKFNAYVRENEDLKRDIQTAAIARLFNRLLKTNSSARRVDGTSTRIVEGLRFKNDISTYNF